MKDRLIELIKEMAKYIYEQLTDGNCEQRVYAVKHIDELKADYLIANGVIVPPCKVGDTVYYFSHRPFNLALLPNTIYEADVVRIVTTRLGTSLVIQIRNEYGVTEVPQISSFGKTVFLTREEAEKALQERKDEGK